MFDWDKTDLARALVVLLCLLLWSTLAALLSISALVCLPPSAWVSTPAYIDPNLPPYPGLGWWIQAGLHASAGHTPNSYEEYHGSNGAYHVVEYSTQPVNYYRNYEVHRIGYRLWKAWIQGAARLEGYLPNDNAQELQAMGELKSPGGSVNTRHRDCKYQYTPGGCWNWFSQSHWEETNYPVWDLQAVYGTYDDFNEVTP